jgi:hypothetical protein
LTTGPAHVLREFGCRFWKFALGSEFMWLVLAVSRSIGLRDNLACVPCVSQPWVPRSCGLCSYCIADVNVIHCYVVFLYRRPGRSST